MMISGKEILKPGIMGRRNLDYLGFPLYEVDTQGSVWSCQRRGGHPTDWHKMELRPTKKGYLTTSLYVKSGWRDGVYELGRRETWFVHHLVLMAFVGPKPFPEAQGRHLNDIKSDNRLENLAWGTQSENMQDLIRNDKFPSRAGECNSAAKLTQAQVDEIRRLYKPRSERKAKSRKEQKQNVGIYNKYSMKNLAKMFGVSLSCISFIVQGRHWKPEENSSQEISPSENVL